MAINTNQQNYVGPMGPSQPGYMQGTANNVTSGGQYVGPMGPSLPGFVQGTAGNVKQPAQSPAPSGGGDPNANKSGYFRNEFGAWTPIGVPTGPSMEELNQAYDPLLSYLGQAESQLRSDMPTYQNEINAQADNSRTALGNNYNTTVQQLGNQGESGAKVRDTSIANAQRLYQELQQANQQRFGAGATGQFASELQGRELQRNSQTSQDSYSGLMQQLGQKRIEVDSNYQLGLKQIEDQKTSAINQINRDFQDKLLQINQQRGAVESQKAQQRLDALQQYRNQVYSIQLQNYQQQQQLDSYRTTQQTQLQSYLDQLSQGAQGGAVAFDQYSQGMNPNTQSQYAPTSGVQQSADMYTGQIAPTKKKYADAIFNPTA